MRSFALLALLLPLAVSAQGTGTLAGRVVDERGEGLPGANVILDGTTLGAATDVDGNYRILGVPVGEYRVTVSSWGYLPVSEQIEVTDMGTHELDFVLAEDKRVDRTVVIMHDCTTPLINNDAFASRVVSNSCGASVWLSDLPVAR